VVPIPKTYKQAIESPHRIEWEKAMQEEINIMKERKVWELVRKPGDSKVLGCRWVYTVKRDDLGNIVRFKARLVAQGYKQIKGETYDETYSPVVNFSVIRFFFSLLVCYLGWSHRQFDVKCAYLYAPLDEYILMSQPQGFSENLNLVCKLKKAIYGLHQSGRVWFFEIDRILSEIGFVKFNHCNCVYIFQNSVIMLLYVDDFVLFCKDVKGIDHVVNLLKNHFDLKALGKTRKLLGVEFEEKEGTLLIHQSSYIKEVYERFNNFNIPIRSLPITKNCIYSKSQSPQTTVEINEMKSIPYRNLLGCLSFLASRTRPDICYVVNILSQFQSDPGLVHWHGLLNLLGYVWHTKDEKLKLVCDLPQIISFSDADFAANRDDRISIGGQLVCLGESPISWKTFKEKCICLSTMESEFVAMTETSRELIWFENILQECFSKNLIKSSKLQPILYVDNQAAINFVKSPVENSRSKHIDIKLLFIRDLVFKEAFQVLYIRSKENLADVFTKPMTKIDLNAFKEKLFDLEKE